MGIGLERSGDRATLTLDGRLVVSAAEAIRDALLEAFSGAREVEVALRDVREADLSLLQLLCAAHRAADARSLPFAVTGLGDAAPVLRLVREAGVARTAGCPPGCPWEAA